MKKVPEQLSCQQKLIIDIRYEKIKVKNIGGIKMNLDVVTFGEPLFLFYANQAGALENVNTWSSALAGAETNVATGFSRLGHKTGFVTKLGNDTFGRFIKNAMQKEKIDTREIKLTNERSTGMYLKGKAAVGDPDIEYFRKEIGRAHV